MIKIKCYFQSSDKNRCYLCSPLLYFKTVTIHLLSYVSFSVFLLSSLRTKLRLNVNRKLVIDWKSPSICKSTAASSYCERQKAVLWKGTDSCKSIIAFEMTCACLTHGCVVRDVYVCSNDSWPANNMEEIHSFIKSDVTYRLNVCCFLTFKQWTIWFVGWEMHT